MNNFFYTSSYPTFKVATVCGGGADEPLGKDGNILLEEPVAIQRPNCQVDVTQLTCPSRFLVVIHFSTTLSLNWNPGIVRITRPLLEVNVSIDVNPPASRKAVLKRHSQSRIYVSIFCFVLRNLKKQLFRSVVKP